MSIAPGGKIKVEITAWPRTAAARKTLRRLCARDMAVQRIDRQRKSCRPSFEQWTRGGAMWNHRMKSSTAAVVAPGESYELRATVDVLRDLHSVEKYVKINKV
jgi:hypothetical protein